MSQSVVPSIWCSTDPDQMVSFYEQVFGDVTRLNTSYYPTEGLQEFQQSMAGQILTIEFAIHDLALVLVNGGPVFQPNPSISFMVRFSVIDHKDPQAALSQAWDALIEGGNALMPLDSYDFSAKYGWVQDKYGVSWQLILDDAPITEDAEGVLSTRARVMPVLMFSGPAANKAEAAMNLYEGLFPDSHIGSISRYPQPVGTATTDSVSYGDCLLNGQWVAFMDSGTTDFTFNEGISLIVNCETQSEIDHYWDTLSTVPEAEQCGWCKDEFGVSWQVTPVSMDELSSNPDAYAAMMDMKKIDLEVLRSFR